MYIRFSGGEFRSLGLAIDPDDPSRAIQVASIESILPDDNWDLDRLALYASSGLIEAARLEKESIQIGRRSTVQIYRSGMALSIARRRLKAQGRGCWGRWLEEHGFKRTTSWEAAELFERAKSEDAVADLTPAQAKQNFSITCPPRENHRAPRNQCRLELPKATDDLDVEDPGPDPGQEDGDEPGTEGGEPSEGDGEDPDPLEPDRPEDEALFSPPDSLRELLAVVCNLLLECERRRAEIDNLCIPLIAEILEITIRLQTETPS